MIIPSVAADQPRVLIAEDHSATREALRSLLNNQGFPTVTFSDGASAQNALLSNDGPTIALLDWMLPGLSGVQICRQVRAMSYGHYTYLIVITARDSTQDAAEAFAAGADDFIRKPCDPEELLARVRCGQRIIDLERKCAVRITELEHMVEQVRQLRQLIPICMYCKRVRDDQAYWQEIEQYIHEQTGSDFSHGICPDCMETVVKEELKTLPDRLSGSPK